MAFETIERVGPAVSAKGGVPADGVRVNVRKAAARGVPVSYIAVQIGPELAKAMCLNPEEIALDLALGNGKDAGHVGLSVNTADGGFIAKRKKSGDYLLTINAASAEGLFSLDFAVFSVPGVSVREAMGKPPMAVFKASDAMLAVAD